MRAVANANMVRAIRAVTVERGLDPRGAGAPRLRRLGSGACLRPGAHARHRAGAVSARAWGLHRHGDAGRGGRASRGATAAGRAGRPRRLRGRGAAGRDARRRHCGAGRAGLCGRHHRLHVRHRSAAGRTGCGAADRASTPSIARPCGPLSSRPIAKHMAMLPPTRSRRSSLRLRAAGAHRGAARLRGADAGAGGGVGVVRPGAACVLRAGGAVRTQVVARDEMRRPVAGPVIIEAPDTTIVIPPGARVAPNGTGGLMATLEDGGVTSIRSLSP